MWFATFISPFEAGSESVFLHRIAGSSAQIFDNLVGREVEELRGAHSGSVVRDSSNEKFVSNLSSI
jgi:hypothetical protein